ncbi:MAG: AI-2E family transporter [Patescibacteria group bacterium]
MDQRNFTISWDFLWKLFFMVLFGWIIFIARDVFAALLLAIVISTAFNPLVSFMEKKRIPRIIGTLLVYLVAIGAIGVILYAFVPIAMAELANLLTYSGKLLEPVFGAPNVEVALQALNVNLSQINDFLFDGGISLAALTTKFFGGLFSAVAIFVLSFYLTAGKDGVEKFLLAILPAAYEPKALRIYERVSRKIGRWLTGQIFMSLIVGIVVFLGLWLLGVRYSLFLGTIAVIAELVPYVGPIFTGSLAALIAFGDSFPLGIYAILLFVAIQQLENHILVPAVMRYTTTLDPVVILIALLIGAKLFGVMGLILAIPVAVFFQEIVEDWAETKQSRRGLMI